MAKLVDPELASSYRFPNLARLHVLIRLFGLRRRWRNLVRRFATTPAGDAVAAGPEITSAFDQAGEHYRERGWAYVESCWNNEFHQSLVRHWPSVWFFEPIKSITKSYDYGFSFGDSKPMPDDVAKFPALRMALDYLMSDEFAARVTALAGDGVERYCYQVLLTRAYAGSSIIPHIDSQNDKNSVNLVMFVDGTGGVDGGGLALWKDNHFGEKIFEPENVTNTCVLYGMGEEFFHGFKPMPPNSFRWTINVTFRGRA